MEPEVVTWLDTLTFAQYQRVMRNVDDYLVDRGDMLDGDHTKAGAVNARRVCESSHTGPADHVYERSE